MLDLALVREQLAIEPEDTSDALLQVYIGAAVRRFESKTQRLLFKTAGDLPTNPPANALVLDADITLALLMLVGHWNVNREATTDLQIVSLPQGFDALANPYRWWP